MKIKKLNKRLILELYYLYDILQEFTWNEGQILHDHKLFEDGYEFGSSHDTSYWKINCFVIAEGILCPLRYNRRFFLLHDSEKEVSDKFWENFISRFTVSKKGGFPW